jgi:hypothetical protein
MAGSVFFAVKPLAQCSKWMIGCIVMSCNHIRRGGTMKRLSLILCVVAMVSGFAAVASAQDVNRKGACRADYQKFCNGVQPGQGRITDCMRRHESELSPECRDALEAIREKTRDFIRACSADRDTFCKGVRPGRGRIVGCLKDNDSKLSPECREQLKR